MEDKLTRIQTFHQPCLSEVGLFTQNIKFVNLFHEEENYKKKLDLWLIAYMMQNYNELKVL